MHFYQPPCFLANSKALNCQCLPLEHTQYTESTLWFSSFDNNLTSPVRLTWKAEIWFFMLNTVCCVNTANRSIHQSGITDELSWCVLTLFCFTDVMCNIHLLATFNFYSTYYSFYNTFIYLLKLLLSGKNLAMNAWWITALWQAGRNYTGTHTRHQSVIHLRHKKQ